MTYIKLVLVGLQIINSLIRYLEEKRLLDEGARQQIARELERTNKLIARSKEIHTKVGTMTNDEVDAALRGDYRD